MGKKNSMENVTIVINMVIGQMSAKRNSSLIVKHKYSECKTKIVNLGEQILKAIFGWD